MRGDIVGRERLVVERNLVDVAGEVARVVLRPVDAELRILTPGVPASAGRMGSFWSATLKPSTYRVDPTLAAPLPSRTQAM
jgi:hypothetical protein